ncbi:MAG: hypothetical protein M1820_010729, partial [Bogoriella megaspora]
PFTRVSPGYRIESSGDETISATSPQLHPRNFRITDSLGFCPSTSGVSTMGNHRRGPWSQQEDTLLLSLVQGQGAHNWVRISQIITSRSPKQCRERYHQNLKPNLKHDPISKEEGEIIERMVREMGKKWAEIARALPGRSDNAVKNWWNGGQNRRKRQGSRQNAELQQHFARALPISPPMRGFQDSRHRIPPLQNQQPLPHPVELSNEESYHSSRQPLSTYERSDAHSVPYSAREPPMLSRSAQPPPQLPALRTARPFESPLPSPSYSAASNEAPSLVSDSTSWTSGRSPHFSSPTDLPLPAYPRWERRRSSCRANGVFDSEGNYTEHEHIIHSDDSKSAFSSSQDTLQPSLFKTPVWSQQPPRRATPPQDVPRLPCLGSHPPKVVPSLPTPALTPESVRPTPYAKRLSLPHISPPLFFRDKDLRSPPLTQFLGDRAPKSSNDDSNIDPQLRSPRDNRMDVSNILSA